MSSLRALLLNRVCDLPTGWIITFMVIFSPWAFGTTQPWAIWTMNGAGYLLGLLLFIKYALRLLGGCRPNRWDQTGGRSHSRSRGRLTVALALFTVLILAYCLISALNARAIDVPQEFRLEFRPCILWLPHSYDALASWDAFWSYLALGLSFWAIRDWLLSKTENETKAERGAKTTPGGLLPDRLQYLLVLLAINGGILGLEAIIQRLSGTGELLFLITPTEHFLGDAQFGPYAYRSNGAQYFNLLWPVCLGLWWTLYQASGNGWKRGRVLSHIVLGCVAIMAICPLVATSRLGAAVDALMILLAAGILWRAQKRKLHKASTGIFAGAVIIFAIGAVLGGEALAPRLESEELQSGFEQREAMYDAAQAMADDHPWLGTGPGTFEHVSAMYRASLEDEWYAQLHNDWLQTLITFGAIGSLFIGVAFVLVLVRWFVPGGVGGGRRLPQLIWLAVAGCLIEARWDFPFQIYSILFVFLILCVILFCLSAKIHASKDKS